MDIIGRRSYPMHMQHSSSREYDCTVTFLKVSDIRVPLQSRSFPAPGSTPPGNGTLPKRCLKLTTLYGTGQQEIGEFQIAGSECDIKQQRTYKFGSTDSVLVTKLHVYVDEVFNSGLTGHVTIDLKEFIGEDDSEILLEYPLSASHLRQRAAKLQIVVQCKGPPEAGPEDAIDDCLDMDLETFLYDEFPDSFLASPCRPEVADLLPRAGTVVEDGQDADGESGALSKIPNLKDFEDEFLGLDAILKDFVAEYSQTRPFLVTGGLRKKPTERKQPTRSDLHAAVFFSAGVTMQQRWQSLEANSQSIMLRVQDSLDEGSSPTRSTSSRVLLRSQSDEFDVKRVLSSPDIPLPEVVTSRKQTALSGFKVKEDPFPDLCSPCPANTSEIFESVAGSFNEAEGPRQSYVQSRTDFSACPTCSVAFESRIEDSHPCHAIWSPADNDNSAATTTAEETQSLIPGSRSKSTRVSVAVVVRNILGVLFIAGVSFVLGMGAHGGFLGPAEETCKDGVTNKWSEIEQMGAWKDTVISQMQMVYDGGMRGLRPSRPLQHYPTLSPSIVANEIDRPDQPWVLSHRKIVARASYPAGTKEVFQDGKVDKVRQLDKEGVYLKNLLSRNRREALSKQVETGPLSMLQQKARIA